jgi:UDP-glucose 4-epimerase
MTVLLKAILPPLLEPDPPALVANADRIKEVLRWRPRYNDLKAIVVGHALALELQLVTRNC